VAEEAVSTQPLANAREDAASVGAKKSAAVDSGGSRKRRLFLTLAAATLSLITAGGLTLRHLERQYGPLETGSFYGIYREHGFVTSKDGFTSWLNPAPDASGELIASLDNRGDHSVKVTSIETGDIATSIRWSVYHVLNGGYITGTDTPWRTFPAVVPPHGTIRLLITIHHPKDCNQYPKIRGISQARYHGWHWVHWESLLSDHRSELQLLDDGNDGIRVC
jgi:hypothetical protein